jgi:hypothetical protein
MNKLIGFSLVLFFLAFSSNTFAQDTYGLPTDEATGKIYYKEVVEVPGTKSELYRRAQKWLHSFFRNTSSVIRLLDEEKGVVEGRRQIKVTTTDKKGRVQPAGAVKYTFRIDLRDGKYRVRLFDFKMANNSAKPLESWFEDTDPKAKALHAQIFKQIDADAKKLLASLKKGMRPTEIKDEEW